MHTLKFLGSVVGTASLATFALTAIVKALQALQTKAAAGTAAKAFFR